MEEFVLKDGRTLVLRRAEESDAEELVSMNIRIGEETDNLSYGKDDYYFTEDEQRLFIRLISDRKDSLFIVALIEGHIIGSITCLAMSRPRLKHRVEVGLIVLKEYWSIGVGSCMISCLMKWANRNELISKLELQVREDNLRGINLYRKYGFEDEGMIDRGILINGTYYKILLMGKLVNR